jgi:hypothetical protein
VSTDSTIKLKIGFIGPNNELWKRLYFIIYVQKPLTKFKSTIWIIIIQCMQQSWHVRFPLLTPQKAMNRGFSDTGLTITLPYGLLGDCVYAFNTVATLS